MATIPSGTKFLGVDPAFTDLTEKKGSKVDRKSEYFTIADIAEEIGPGPTGPQGVQGPAGPQGALGPVGPAGLEWRGAWVSGTSYVADDAVGYGGASYFCISATSGTTTPNLDTTKWALLAAQGAQGQTGATGAQGPQGPTGPQGAGASQTLQQTVNLGNTITNGTSTSTLSANQFKVGDSSTTGITINPNQITSKGNGGTVIVNFPTSVSGGTKVLTVRDLSGTIALTSDVTLQKAIDLGNTITNGSVTSTLTATNFKVASTSTSGLTLNSNQITCKKSSNDFLINFPNTISDLQVATFQDATGTIAYLEDFSLNNNTTSALSLSTLNSQYPSTFYYNGFRVFCPNITGGGLVYTKTGDSTWVSQTITTVS
jgi:hypothetical protein